MPQFSAMGGMAPNPWMMILKHIGQGLKGMGGMMQPGGAQNIGPGSGPGKPLMGMAQLMGGPQQHQQANLMDPKINPGNQQGYGQGPFGPMGSGGQHPQMGNSPADASLMPQQQGISPQAIQSVLQQWMQQGGQQQMGGK